MKEQRIGHKIKRMLRHDSAIAYISAAWGSLTSYIVASQEIPTVRELPIWAKENGQKVVFTKSFPDFCMNLFSNSSISHSATRCSFIRRFLDSNQFCPRLFVLKPMSNEKVRTRMLNWNHDNTRHKKGMKNTAQSFEFSMSMWNESFVRLLEKEVEQTLCYNDREIVWFRSILTSSVFLVINARSRVEFSPAVNGGCFWYRHEDEIWEIGRLEW
jgi:hypothetical protein